MGGRENKDTRRLLFLNDCCDVEVDSDDELLALHTTEGRKDSKRMKQFNHHFIVIQHKYTQLQIS